MGFKISKASDIINIEALNSKIILLHFDDGYVRYHKKGESRQNEWVVSEPLVVEKAMIANNYQIVSSEGYYSNPQNPGKVTRKSKGTEYTWLCENWSQLVGCVNTSPDHAKEHWIYLHLNEPLEMGKKYTILTNDIAGNGNEWELNFTLEKNRTEAVHVNIIGYDSHAPKKYGYVYHWSGEAGGIDFSNYEGNNFYLINTETNEKAFSGTLKFRKDKYNADTRQSDTPNGNYSGADVYECDFSNFNVPGEYILAVESIGHSFPFKITKDVYRLPYYTSIRGLYHNRSGIALEEPFTEYTRPAPHNPLETPGFSGKLFYTTSRFIDWEDLNNSPEDKPAIEEGILGPINTWGWYQDAGDWDGYFWHMKVPAILMLTWEIAPEKFADGELNLPEGTNGIPDILDEASWLIRFFYRTRHEIMNKGYGTGGVGSRVAPDWFGHAENGTPSYLDNGKWIISGEDPFTTYFYAGLAGHYALVLDKLGIEDPHGIDWKKEAEEAFEWARNNTKATDTNPANVHDFKLTDFELYAAASLFRLTGEKEYKNTILEIGSSINSSDVLDEYEKFGVYALVTGKEKVLADDAFLSKLKGAIIASADQKYSSINQRACRFGGNIWLPMVVGQGTTPRVFEMMLGHFVSKDFAPSKTSNYLAGIFTTADYFLGCNPLNQAYITHVGVRYPERVLHLDSWYSETGEIIPGITPYGPWRDQGSGPNGPWDVRWPYQTLFPKGIENWPGHERWFNNYTTPSNAEFTVHQNTVLSAAVYGYLCDVPDGTFVPNKKPSIEILSPEQSDEIKGNIEIKINVSDPNGENDIAWVEFFNEWHKIGQSNQPPYTFTWKKPSYGDAKISAKVIDKSGFSTNSDTVNILVKPLNYNSSIVVSDSITGELMKNCKVTVNGQSILTDDNGKATFDSISGLMNIYIEKTGYNIIELNEISVYSDTTLYYNLAQKEKETVFIFSDKQTGELLSSVSVEFNGKTELTKENGEALFKVYNGSYTFIAGKNSFAEETGNIDIVSDTTVFIELERTDADIKFVLKMETTPVNKAFVVLNNDTLESTSIGIARFKSLPVSSVYEYKIYKEGFDDVNGTLFLQTDTTVNVAMKKYTVGVEGFSKSNVLKTWPNPVSNQLEVHSKYTINQITVYSITGSKMKLQIRRSNELYQIDFSEVNPGIYFLKIKMENGDTVIRKIIKS